MLCAHGPCKGVNGMLFLDDKRMTSGHVCDDEKEKTEEKKDKETARMI